MAFRFQCGQCGTLQEVADPSPGSTIQCPACGVPLTVPGSPPAMSQPQYPSGQVSPWHEDEGSQYSYGAASRKSGVPAWVWWLCGGIFAVVLVCGGLIFAVVRFAMNAVETMAGKPGVTISTAPDLATARRDFQTKLNQRGPAPQEYDVDDVPPDIERVTFQSPAGQLFGWFAKPPGPGPFPAVLHAHGGFALGEQDFDDVRPFLDAGFVVFVPAWRAENGNPGNFELYYGEVDDAAAALDWLAARPDIDSKRLFATGHSAGGTIAMLLAEISPRLRGAMACGGTLDSQAFTDSFHTPPHPQTPFNWNNPLEGDLRSPGRHIRDLKCPLALYFSPTDDQMLLMQAQALEPKAKELGLRVTVESVPGSDHYTALATAVRKSVTFFQTLASEP